MNCPKCKHFVSFFGSWTILNPKYCHCPKCTTPLTLNRIGKILYSVSLCIGIVIASIAIFMEESSIWTTYNSIVFFIISFPIIIFTWSYIFWKNSNFIIQDQKKSIITKKMIFSVYFTLAIILSTSIVLFSFSLNYGSKELGRTSQYINDIEAEKKSFSEEQLKKLVVLGLKINSSSNELITKAFKAVRSFCIALFIFCLFIIWQLFVLDRYIKQSENEIFDNIS